MKSITLICAPLFAVAALFLSGCSAPANNEPASDANSTGAATTTVAVNERCPIMGGKVTAEGGSADWNGKTIGFCCPECIDKWNALSDEEKQAKLDKAASTDGETEPDHSDHVGHEGHEKHGDHKSEPSHGETKEQ